tara:strand:+ start:105 stop:260 length:156 start_codon:yes stop_codon:yes gene_type:complete
MKLKHKHKLSDKRINFDLYLDKYPSANFGHPNEEGHRMIADDIIKIIERLI